ncbi:HNH endonuclease signature motif containing protein [Streptomyces sp. NPDC051104]|uniref:HNH endonuclease signature motif containing protein n=1 Tax=Streptomyces sp. NPDC051104 TaxID=3155044 RepID=UPI0034270AA5
MLKAKTCSKRCSDVARGTVRAMPLTTRTCVRCGGEFTPRSERGVRCASCSQKNCSGPRWPLICSDCGAPTRRGSTSAGRFCEACANERKRARNTRKNHRRRIPLAFTDITAEYERSLRKRTGRCLLCSVVLSDEQGLPTSKHLDHIIPIAIGGTHTIGNVRIICRTCNLSRPKDGSDLLGHQPTLWANDVTLAAALVVVPPRCRCGAKLRDGRCRKCEPKRKALRTEDGVRAAVMRADGAKWQQISDLLGFSGPGTAYYAAQRFGDPEVIAKWPGARRWSNQAAA